MYLNFILYYMCSNDILNVTPISTHALPFPSMRSNNRLLLSPPLDVLQMSLAFLILLFALIRMTMALSLNVLFVSSRPL